MTCVVKLESRPCIAGKFFESKARYSINIFFFFPINITHAKPKPNTLKNQSEKLLKDQVACNFFTLNCPSYKNRSMAAATVNVPPMTAQTPVRNPVKLFGRVSRLMTFIGEMS